MQSRRRGDYYSSTCTFVQASLYFRTGGLKRVIPKASISTIVITYDLYILKHLFSSVLWSVNSPKKGKTIQMAPAIIVMLPS